MSAAGPPLEFEGDQIRITFYEDVRVIHWRVRAGSRLKGADGEVAFAWIDARVGDEEPWSLMCDAAGLSNADSGYRRLANVKLGAHGTRMKMVMYNLPTLISVMFTMFLRITPIDGRAFPTVDGAYEWLGLGAWRLPASDSPSA